MKTAKAVGMKITVIWCFILHAMTFSGCTRNDTQGTEMTFIANIDNDTLEFHQDGIWNILDRSGKLMERGRYKGGKRIGVWEGFYWNGKIMWRGQFHSYPEIDKAHLLESKNAGIIGDSGYSGIKFVEDIYEGEVFGEESVPMSRWGQAIYDGVWEHFDTNGRLIILEFYKEGRLVWQQLRMDEL
jgi:antitoxin component YwqK of YwqJK toxin-antitoxin module